jgi:hypothetical protein
MDTFLKNLYQEDLTKQSSADLRRLYAGLSVSDLREVLGLQKVAVEGSAEPVTPTGAAAAPAAVSEKAVPKKTESAELPDAPLNTMVAAIKRLGRGAMEGPSISPALMEEVDGHPKRTAGERSADYGDALGVGEKTAQAEMLCTAMQAVEGAPEHIRDAAIKLAASRL